MWKNLSTIAQQLVAPDEGDDNDEYSEDGWDEEDDDVGYDDDEEDFSVGLRGGVGAGTSTSTQDIALLESPRNDVQGSGLPLVAREIPTSQYTKDTTSTPAAPCSTNDQTHAADPPLIDQSQMTTLYFGDKEGEEEGLNDFDGWGDEEVDVDDLDLSSSHPGPGETDLPTQAKDIEVKMETAEQTEDPVTVVRRNSKELSSKTLECNELKLEIEGLRQHLQALEKELGEKTLVVENMASAHKQEIVLLEDQVQAAELNKENLVDDLTRRLNESQSEIKILKASVSNPPNVALRKQHEEDLQAQYILLDRKTERIRALESQCTHSEKIARESQAELQQIATELLVVVQERDVLERSLRETVNSVKKLQLKIENGSQGGSFAEAQFEANSLRETLREVQTENGHLKQQLDDLNVESRSLDKNLSCVKLENASLAAELERSNMELQKAADQNVSLERANEALLGSENKRIELHDELSSLRKLLGIDNDLDMPTYLGTLTRTAEEVKIENEQLKAENLALRNGHPSLLGNIGNETLEMQQLLDETTIHETNAVAKAQEVRELNIALEKKVIEANEIISSLRQGFQEKSQAVDTLEKEVDDLRRQLEANSNDVVNEGRLRLETDRLNGELEMYRQGFEEKSQAIDTLEKEVDDLRRQLEANSNDVVNEERLRLETDRLNGELEMYRQGFEEKSQAVDTLEKEVDDLRRQLEANSNDVVNEGRLRLETDRLNGELEMYRQGFEEKSQAVDTLEKEVDDLRRQLEANSNDVVNEERLRLETDRLNGELEMYRQGFEEKSQAVDTLEKEVDDLRRQLEANSNDVVNEERLRLETDRLNGELEMYRQGFEEKSQAVDTLEKEVDDLRRQLEANSNDVVNEERLRLETDRLNGELEMYRQGFEEKSQAVDTLEKEVDDLRRQLEANSNDVVNEERLRLETDRLNGELEMYRQGFEEKSQAVNTLEKEVEFSRQEAQTAVAAKSRLEAALRDAQSGKNSVEIELNRVKVEQQRVQSALNNFLSQENTSYHTTGTTKTSAQTKVEEMQHALDDLQLEKSLVDEELDEIRVELHHVKAVNVSFEKQLEENTRTLHSREYSIKELHDRVELLEADQNDLRRKNEQLNKENESLRTTAREKSNRLESLESLVEQVQLEKSFADDELHDIRSEKEQFETQSLNLEKALCDAKKVMEELVETNQQLQLQVSQHSDLLERSKQDISVDHGLQNYENNGLQEIKLARDQALEEVANLRVTIGKFAAREQETLAKIDTQESKIAELTLALESIELEKSLLEDDYKAKEVELADALCNENTDTSIDRDTFEQIQRELGEAKTRLSEAEANTRMDHDEINRLQSALTISDDKNKVASQSIDETKIQLDAVSSKLEETAKERDDAVIRFHQLQHQFQADRHSLQAEVERYREMEAFASVETEENEKRYVVELETLRDMNDQLRNSFESAKAELEIARETEKLLSTSIDELNVENQRIARKLSSIEALANQDGEKTSLILSQCQVLLENMRKLESCLRLEGADHPTDSTSSIAEKDGLSCWLDEVMIRLELLDSRLVKYSDRLVLYRDEHDHFVAENEEMLVQFGLLKQQMDDSEALLQNLRMENISLQQQTASADTSKFTEVYNTRLSRRNEELEAQAQDLSKQRDLLKDRLNQLEIAIAKKQTEENTQNLDDHQKPVTDQIGRKASEVVTDSTDQEMRAIIVALASALERSEKQRSSAMHQVVVEREFHVQSVRDMTDSVRRFYASLAVGDI